MKLHNTLTKQIQDFAPLAATTTIYSCGPTVYDHIHIGNLRAFVTADILRRSLAAQGQTVRQVMNLTDIDDKTIARSQQRYPEDSPEIALKKLTDTYTQIFMEDITAIGNQTDAVEFVRATDHIAAMQQLIDELYKAKVAYVADDGVYFSIQAYRAAHKTYGQLLKLDSASTSAARINNDEYDKASVHDFSLWKLHKDGEPAWDFTLDGHSIPGRPGWHIECSAMSVKALGQPFDIHTGGVDLIFPHHENEIAQSTATSDQPLAKVFVHNEHLLVDGRKMSKSLQNFYTLADIKERGFDPLAYRLLILQAHYRKPLNFTWEALEAAQNRLYELRSWADLQFQNFESAALVKAYHQLVAEFELAMTQDLDTPAALAAISQLVNATESVGIDHGAVKKATLAIDNYLGLGLSYRQDLADSHKAQLVQRQAARQQKDWSTADQLRQQLETAGIYVKDTPQGQVWSRPKQA